MLKAFVQFKIVVEYIGEPNEAGNYRQEWVHGSKENNGNGVLLAVSVFKNKVQQKNPSFGFENRFWNLKLSLVFFIVDNHFFGKLSLEIEKNWCS